MSTCAVCDQATSTNLCDACAEDVDVPLPFVPEQIMSGWSRASDAALIDMWGRAHRLEARTGIGRIPTARGLSILHGSISRRHAELLRSADGAWSVVDLGSSNGTRVNDKTVQRSPLATGDRVSFGSVGFFFTQRIATLVDDLPDEAASRTLRPGDAKELELAVPEPTDEATFAGLPSIGLQLLEAPSGGGGYLAIGNRQLQLTDTQFELLRTLARRVTSEVEVPEVVRGFVPSGQLIADLPWDSISPSENNLKQLVRRVRKLLDEARLGTLIESRRGFGYRLRAIPRQPFEGRPAT